MSNENQSVELPSIEELETELTRKKTKKNKHYRARIFITVILLELIAVGLFALRGIVGTWAAIAAGVLLLALVILLLRSWIRRKRSKKAAETV